MLGLKSWKLPKVIAVHYNGSHLNSYLCLECPRAYNCGVKRLIQGIHKRMVRFQKITRNLFLTLRGHNVHRQQWQLSKFFVRYQQFASHAYCGAAGSVSKMVSQQGRALCVLHFEVSRSVITVHKTHAAL